MAAGRGALRRSDRDVTKPEGRLVLLLAINSDRTPGCISDGAARTTRTVRIAQTGIIGVRDDLLGEQPEPERTQRRPGVFT
jgi:hypothetical protein